MPDPKVENAGGGAAVASPKVNGAKPAVRHVEAPKTAAKTKPKSKGKGKAKGSISKAGKGLLSKERLKSYGRYTLMGLGGAALLGGAVRFGKGLARGHGAMDSLKGSWKFGTEIEDLSQQ
jgi:hypothetical protein